MSERDLLKLLKEMVSDRPPRSGEQLYRALPQIYRQEDEDNWDLRRYLDASGTVLDQLRRTLDMRLRDISPLTCQSWLLPYFADLLDVHVLSPDEYGRRQEIARAVDWRQRKGTVAVCVEIAEAVGQAPIIGVEGHRSVARTPRVDRRRLTLRELGERVGAEPDTRTPSVLAKRPGTPAVTADFRSRSQPRRMEDGEITPLVETTRFRLNDQDVYWQPENPPHGMACDLHGYRDVAMRTVDTRDPSWKAGQHHPKRFRLFTPVPEGFTCTDTSSKIESAVVDVLMTPRDVPEAWEWRPVRQGDGEPQYLLRRDSPIAGDRDMVRIEERLLKPGAAKDNNNSPGLRIRSTLLTLPDGGDRPLDEAREWEANWPGNARLYNTITGRTPGAERADDLSARVPQTVSLDGWDRHWHQNGFLLQWERWFEPDNGDGAWHFILRGGTWNRAERRPGRAGEAVDGRSHLAYPPRWPVLTGDVRIKRQFANKRHVLTIEQLIIVDQLVTTADHLMISKTGANTLTASLKGDRSAEAKATDCLIHTLAGALGTVELEHCTIVAPVTCKEELRASDCLLLGDLTKTEAPKRLKLRYSCTPRLDRGKAGSNWVVHEPSVQDQIWPAMHGQALDRSGVPTLDAAGFGTRGYGVLKQSAHPSIRQGAEDGGELGAFHHRGYCGRQDAVTEKLRQYLPVGVLPALIVDEHWRAPIRRPEEDSGGGR